MKYLNSNDIASLYNMLDDRGKQVISDVIKNEIRIAYKHGAIDIKVLLELNLIEIKES